MAPRNPFGSHATLDTQGGKIALYRLDALSKQGIGHVDRLPVSIKVLLEACLRNCDNFEVTEQDVKLLADWNAKAPAMEELPFKPARVILQDFTGVPVVVDLAAMRAAMARLGGDPKKINPLVPVDLVIDHSVQVDKYGTADALAENARIEFARNMERYQFLRWGQKAFDNFRVVPPATGIVHQVNLEYLAKVVLRRKLEGEDVAIPDSLVGTDSHTTMIDGLGVVGWGVGGIEAEAVMLGQPIYMLTPEVVGFRITGKMPDGATGTDLVLMVTQMLRKKGVVGKFVEFYGPGVASMSLADRATIANMSPEYGATMGFFPVDEKTLQYLRLTGRSAEEVDLVERYTKEQGLWASSAANAEFTDTLELDLSKVEPSLAGPKRPQDRVALKDMKKAFNTALAAPIKDRGFALAGDALTKTAPVEMKGQKTELKNGSVVIAAITSCTNTSNPSVLVAAGLVAKKAVEKGLSSKPFVKTSLGPGSRVVTDYLKAAGLLPYLEQLGFNVVGYGCTTCIGNSGPLPEAVSKAVAESDVVAAAVLSGNRNFEGRVHAQVKANYLASPPLVVAYALAGTVDIDMNSEPLGTGKDGKPVFMKDVWPTTAEVEEAVSKYVTPEQFKKSYANVFEGSEEWKKVPVAASELYAFDAKSTYIQEPPFFAGLEREPGNIKHITGAKTLVMLGDSITTDHISPAGDIDAKSPAGSFLQAAGVAKDDFNSYGSRRGNDRVMTRGTFANVRLRNQLAPGKEGPWTTFQPSGELMTIFEASEKYKKAGVPLVVLAGKEYGSGSSRDWAAKGPFLLGVKAVIAESYERIHRSNLVGMGVLPLQFEEGQNRESLKLTGNETFEIGAKELNDKLKPRQKVSVTATTPDGKTISFSAIARIDTPVEVEYYRNGGILQTVLRRLLKAK
ncbi:MAG: aconitate hydratase AcnA [Deltaproteobacteria bacterium]|nr:aconitate hydratase AcnA [Deltaproteobacteria bacterium]